MLYLDALRYLLGKEKEAAYVRTESTTFLRDSWGRLVSAGPACPITRPPYTLNGAILNLLRS